MILFNIPIGIFTLMIALNDSENENKTSDNLKKLN